MKFSNEKIEALKNKAAVYVKNTKEKVIELTVASREKAGETIAGSKVKLDRFVTATKEKMENSNVDFSFLEKVHFNFHHFTTVSIVAVLAFFITLYSTGYNTTSVNAENLVAPKVLTANKKALDVDYGDTDEIAALAKDLMGNTVSDVVNPTKVSEDGYKTVYALDTYMLTVELDETLPLGQQKATVSVETKATYEKSEMEKVVVYTGIDEEIQDGTVYRYDIAVNVKDTEAPKINMVYNDMTIADTDEFDVNDYIIAVTDNVDGVITNYVVDGAVTKDGDVWEAGRHDLTITAQDSSGNVASTYLIVRVKETVKEEEVSETSSRSQSSYVNQNASYVGSYAGGSAVASAALAQVGRYQDCTALVTNALRAVGIYYHSSPAGYFALGTTVPASQAQPGDLIYYADAGLGIPHIAVYVGNGMAVHGGWNGNQTVVLSAYVGSGPVFIRLS